MDLEIKEYKGYSIIYNEFKERFEAENKEGDEIASDKSLKELEKKLDILLKKKFKRIPAWLSSWGGPIKCEITSYNHQDKNVWVSSKEGRSKESIRAYTNLIKDSEKNKPKIIEILNLIKIKEDTEKKIDSLKSSLEKFTLQDFES